jgi:hypothetical protein
MSKTAASQPPRFWTHEPDGRGGQRLAYAVREGGWRWFSVVLGVALLAGGVRVVVWFVPSLASLADLTLAGWALLGVGAGGALLAGVYVLDAVLWARVEYGLGPGALTERRVSIFGTRTQEIPRSLMLGIAQQYTPPRSGGQGDWVTFIEWRDRQGRRQDFAFDGMCTPQERQWLGRLLADWTQLPLRSGFSASVEDEADPAELPDD